VPKNLSSPYPFPERLVVIDIQERLLPFIFEKEQLIQKQCAF